MTTRTTLPLYSSRGLGSPRSVDGGHRPLARLFCHCWDGDCRGGSDDGGKLCVWCSRGQKGQLSVLGRAPSSNREGRRQLCMQTPWAQQQMRCAYARTMATKGSTRMEARVFRGSAAELTVDGLEVVEGRCRGHGCERRLCDAEGRWCRTQGGSWSQLEGGG